MKYEITKLYNGDLEFVYGKKSVMLTNANSKITITDDEYMEIPDSKRYLFVNGFVAATQIDEDTQETSKLKKK
ncbi:MAG: hypothetical protein ACRDD7_03485 [Peptostreptococcaceae bacterium]